MQPGRIFFCACLLAGSVISLQSCHKGNDSGWNTQLLVPLATTNLSLQNLVTDSTLITNKDSSLTLSFQSSLYQFNLASQIIKIPDTSIGQKFTLDSLSLPNIRFLYIASLGDIAQNLISTGNPTNIAYGQAIISLNQQTVVTPALSNLSVGSFNFNAGQFFDSAYLISGQVQVWVINHLPDTLKGVTCAVSNTSGNNTSVIATYSNQSLYIPPGDSQYIDIYLNPAHITSNLQFSITDLSTLASGSPVYVDTSAYVALRVFVCFLRVSEAWGKFPSQSIVNNVEEVTDKINDRLFTFIQAKSGFLHIYITNSVPQPLFLKYTLLGAYNSQGQPLVEYTTVPAAPPNSSATIDTLLNIAGYSINLTGIDGTKFNTYTQQIAVSIDSTGTTQHITLADSLNIRYEIQDIAPEYIKGYAGRDTVLTIDSAAFSFLNIFKHGSLNLQSVNMNFSVQNGLGVDGMVQIDTFTAISSYNGSANLMGPILGQPLYIKAATDFPLTPSINNFSINNSNSNINKLLGILPDKLLYHILLRTNIHGNNGQYREFAYLQSNLGINLDAEIPLSLIANNLVLQDTINFNLGNTQTNVAGISSGLIYVIAENKYPITANLTMVIYDSTWDAVDTLIANQTVASANLDNNCRADAPKQTIIPEYVDQAVINKLKLGQYAVITANFSTSSGNNALCNGQHLKIYSDYNIGITLSAKFNYKVKTGF